jgi:hypothetical protein
MPAKKPKFWWERLPAQVTGDAIIAEVGGGAKNVAIGKGIHQTVHEILGDAGPEDPTEIEDGLQQLSAAIADLSGKVDEATANMAAFQAELLKGELSKTGEEDQPSANTITQVGDWLLDNVPEIAETLTGLFATPAVGRVVGKAGRVAVDWVRRRIGGG